MSKYSKRTSKAAATSGTEFNPDYTHVKRDLSRIGVLAGSFLVILVVLSFFIK
jgi:ABC-type spermidine/putrescine transport system permease subunit I